MPGYAIADGSSDIGDAMGEICNIVVGRIRLLLDSQDLRAAASLPTVISASQFRILLKRQSVTDYAHFQSPAGRLWTIVTVGMGSKLGRI